MDKKWWFFIFSLIIILPGLFFLFRFGLKLGIDFKGGTLLEYRLKDSANNEELKDQLSFISVSNIVNSSDDTVIIKAEPLEGEQISQVSKKLIEKYGEVEVIRVESVGPVIGSETAKNALIALVVASLAIVLYIAVAFRKVPKPTSSWRFGVAAIVALLHDVILVVGVFSMLGYFLGVEIDVLFVTALLTIIGFSVHDTIVVFDRIRENLPKHLSKNFSDIANISITQTLARSLNTSLTVVFVLLALLFFGGESIRWFVVALLVGVISGTYSSIFNATALLTLWEEKLGH